MERGQAVRQCVTESFPFGIRAGESFRHHVPDDQAGHLGHHVKGDAEQGSVVETR